MLLSKQLSIGAACAAVLLMTLVACHSDEEPHGHELPEVDCEVVTPPQFADVALLDSCTGCHSSTLTDADRNGAPVDVNYDTYEDAVAGAEHGAEAVNAGIMPPGGGTLTEEDKQAFYAWALCGQPQ